MAIYTKDAFNINRYSFNTFVFLTSPKELGLFIWPADRGRDDDLAEICDPVRLRSISSLDFLWAISSTKKR